MVSAKSLEIFCGTGGVGKTTLATSRALSLAIKGKKVLLITIDPAKRLKDLLSLDDKTSGEVVKVHLANVSLDALLMSPEATILRMANAEGNQHLSHNRIIKILARPYGGMNEILSLIEVQMQIETGLYETIVLDTPPGSHFLDFLESLNKMKNFFDQNFVEIFHYLGEKTALSKKGFFGQNFIKHIVSSGVRKLLTYLQSVTGAQFIEEFIEALSVIYKSKSAFLKGLKLQDQFKSPQVCNWFLVTSVEQGKAEEAVELKAHASHFIHHDHLLILNKCLSRDLDSWDPQDTQLQKLKFSLYSKEESLKNELNKVFHNILEFPEIISGNPSEHVTQLAEEWNRHVSH